MVVGTQGVRIADVRIEGERIIDVGTELAGGGEEIDARGLLVLPGVVDVHVHFNEPGQTD